MLGYQVLRLGLKRNLDIQGIVRDKSILQKRLGSKVENRLHVIDDAKNFLGMKQLIEKIRPDYLINCIGIVKQSHLAEDPYESIAINSFFPHQMEKYCSEYDCKLIHISTDCVFDGKNGNYKESDLSNATDLYGRSKFLGEVGYGSALTLRTSIIGHEITKQKHGLLEWFLSQRGRVRGFTKAIFSGLTTKALTEVMLDTVIPQSLPADIYNVASDPISKYDLLKIFADAYGIEIEIDPDERLDIDRSLDGTKFTKLTGYLAPSWPNLVKEMAEDFNQGF